MKQALIRRPSKFRRPGKLEDVLHEMKIDGVFTAEGDDWKRQRKLTAPAFTPMQVRNHYDSIATVCIRLQNQWKKRIQSSSNNYIQVNVLEDLMKFTLDIVSIIAFGYDLNSIEQHSPIVDHLLVYMPTIHKRVNSIVPHWRLFSMESDKKFYKAENPIKELVDSMIKEYYEKNTDDIDDSKTKGHKNRSFIKTMLNAWESSDDQLSDKEILGNCITLLLAGQDTTANTLSWAMYYLSRNQKIQEDLNKEINTLKTNEEFGITDKSELSNLSCCTNVIRETLRLRGPTPVLFLEAVEPNELDLEDGSKLNFNKGDIMIMLNRVMQTDEKQFKNAKQFIPSRWEEEINSFYQNLPFGGGPRVCPGKALSIMESTVFMSMLCKEFIVRPPNVDNIKIDETLKGTEDPNVHEELAFTMGPENLLLNIFLRSD